MFYTIFKNLRVTTSRPPRRLEDQQTSKTSCEDVLKTSWKHLENVLQNVLKTSWRGLGSRKTVTLKTSWRRLEDVLKAYLEEVLKTCLEDVSKTPWKQTNLNVYIFDLANLHLTNLYLTNLRRIQNALIRSQ